MDTAPDVDWTARAMRRYKTNNVVEEGQIALVLPCRDMKVILCPTEEEAERLRESIGWQCGGNCWGT